ncbi:NTP transferase domain-containing protein [Alphaproteobacteria bacterium]|nr:NTP transferase domain-containing protein [Alphaproteobacteria bacterium]MDB2406717.1 NTP transferase domain-containing protein [Alphaproteobacteria bacterium]MDB2540615.1 NTP transferase domain-containing protein [Alphaproteobacteria bacterium]MDB2649026.1 NTP transferase domain-containing protein [Alphaproteobacteria bacterium]
MIVIPLLGDAQRFTSSGYGQNKFLLEIGGRRVIDWTLRSFSRIQEQILIVYRSDLLEPSDFGDLSSNVFLTGYDKRSKGQAESVAIGIAQHGVPPHEPLHVFNGDSFFFPAIEAGEMPKGNYVDLFLATGDHWSFCKVESNLITEIAEKKRISEFCSTGLYGFESSGEFSLAYEKISSKRNKNEIYISSVIDGMIKDGAKFRPSFVSSRLILCGTPSEYETSRKEFNYY